MFLYHIFFIAGYILGVKIKLKNDIFTIKKIYNPLYYWAYFLTGILAILLGYSNIMLTDGIIPYDLFHKLQFGFTEPGLAYSERMLETENIVNSGSRLFNIISIFFSFYKFLFIYYVIYFWNSINLLNKLMAFMYASLIVMTSVAAGVNSIIFIFFIFSSVSLIIILYLKGYVHTNKIILFCACIFIFPLGWFGKIMYQRGGGFDYFSSTSPMGDISVSSNFMLSESSSILDFIYYSYVWLSYYIVQGYYGFSLILSLDWNWTYGFGGSAFLQRQFLMLTGLDISNQTFQSRISNVWDATAQWHSFYGQIANDVGIFGLILFMFLLGYFVARVWISAIYQNSFFGSALMPMLAIMFIFFPANNQVLGYIDTLSYFIFISLLWILEKYRSS
jgi:hypothetical protein